MRRSAKILSLLLFIVLVGGLIPVRAQEVTAEPDMAAEQIVETVAPAAEQTPAVEAPAAEPTAETPAEQPATEAPVTEQPATEAPVTEQPATEAPVTEQPATEAPVTEQPATEAPVTEQPATETPVEVTPAPVVTLEPTLVPTVIPTAVPTEDALPAAPAPTLPQIFASNFEGGLPAELSSTGWQLVDISTGKALQSSGGADSLTYGTADLNDLTLSVRAQISSGSLRLIARQTTAGLYALDINASGELRLYRSGALLGSAQMALEAGQWITLRLDVAGGALKAIVDNALVLSATDPAPLMAGKVGISASSSTQAQIDDFIIYASSPIVAEAPAAPAVMPPAEFGAAMQAQNRVRPEVISALQNSETVRVIINYTTPVSVRGLNDAQRISTIRSQAALVKNALPVSDVTVSHEFDIVPAMAAEVTRAGAMALADNPMVESVQIDGIVHKALSTARIQIDVPEAEALGYDGSGINVAVLDTGIDASHPNLADDVVAQKCFLTDGCPGGGTQSNNAADGDGHGTHVSGIITSNHATHKGIANGAGIVAVKILTDEGYGYDSDIIAGLNWVYNNRNTYNIRVVNMSLGSNYNTNSYCDSAFPSYATVINKLASAGVVVVMASGNESSSSGISSPACIRNGLAIGAVNSSDRVASFSNVGSILDVYAPGNPINSTVPGGGFDSWSGTSMASPAAAGVVALMLDANPNLTFSEVRTILQTTGPSITARGYTFRRVDADDAIAAAGGGTDPEPADERSMLMALYDGTSGANWTSRTGWNTTSDYCTWYGVTCTSGLVTGIDLSRNNLSGSIPAGFTSLSNLTSLNLSGNALSGEVPASFTSLSSLTSLNISYNALTATNSSVVSFLNGLSPDWWASQTVAPSSLAASGASQSSLDLSWSAIAYTGGGGYYEVRYSTSSSGPYDQIGCTTADKTETACVIDGLNGGTQYTFVVRAYTPAGDNNPSELWSANSSSISARTLGSDTPTLGTPVDGEILEYTPRPTFTWADVDNVVYYRIQVANNPDFRRPMTTVSRSSSLKWRSNLPSGDYYWRVQAYANRAWTDWTPANTFSLIAPGPMLDSPADGTALEYSPRPTFVWQDIAGAARYRIQVANNPDFRRAMTAMSSTSSTNWRRNLTSGTWYWRVQAFADGIWTDFSNAFTLTLSAPGPTLDSPADGDALEYTPRPTFVWQDIAGAARYRIQVANNPDFRRPMTAMSPTSSTNWRRNLESGTWYWRVQAFADGIWTDWSTPSILTLSAPGPILASPNNGASLEYSPRPTFTWNDLPGTAYYRVQVANNPDFRRAAMLTARTNSLTWNRNLLSGDYYWRVQAFSGGIWTDWSTPSTLTLSAPGPILASPNSGASLEYSPRPTFTWNDLPGTAYYRVQVANNPDFRRAAMLTARTNSLTWNRNLLSGDYYWRVQAFADGIWTDWSTPSILTLSAPAPAMISPMNGATLHDGSPTFSWNALSGVAYSQVQVASNANFTRPLTRYVRTNQISWPYAMQDGVTYYWRVRSYVNGIWTDWSSQPFNLTLGS